MNVRLATFLVRGKLVGLPPLLLLAAILRLVPIAFTVRRLGSDCNESSIVIYQESPIGVGIRKSKSRTNRTCCCIC